MLITIGSTKGGVGKTTIAVNLAIGLTLRGRDVLLVDGDEQGTAQAFTTLRISRHPELKTYTTVQLFGKNIRSQVKLLRHKYTDIIIDVGGHGSGSESLRSAMIASTLIIIPTAPRSFDLWGVDDTAKLVEQARDFNDQLGACTLLNGAEHTGSDNAQAGEALAEFQGINVLDFTLGRRKAFPAAAAEGLSVLEYVSPSNPEGSMKAREEFTTLLNFIVGGAE